MPGSSVWLLGKTEKKNLLSRLPLELSKVVLKIVVKKNHNNLTYLSSRSIIQDALIYIKSNECTFWQWSTQNSWFILVWSCLRERMIIRFIPCHWGWMADWLIRDQLRHWCDVIKVAADKLFSVVAHVQLANHFYGSDVQPSRRLADGLQTVSVLW